MLLHWFTIPCLADLSLRVWRLGVSTRLLFSETVDLPRGRTGPGVDHQLESESFAAVNLGIGGRLQGLQIFLFFLLNSRKASY